MQDLAWVYFKVVGKIFDFFGGIVGAARTGGENHINASKFDLEKFWEHAVLGQHLVQ